MRPLVLPPQSLLICHKTDHLYLFTITSLVMDSIYTHSYLHTIVLSRHEFEKSLVWCLLIFFSSVSLVIEGTVLVFIRFPASYCAVSHLGHFCLSAPVFSNKHPLTTTSLS